MDEITNAAVKVEAANAAHNAAIEALASHEEGSDEHDEAKVDVEVAETNLDAAIAAHVALAEKAVQEEQAAQQQAAQEDPEITKLHDLIAKAELHVGAQHTSILTASANEIRSVVAELRAFLERIRNDL